MSYSKGRAIGRCLTLLLSLLLPQAIAATPVLSLQSLPDSPLGRQLTYLQEGATPLSLPEAIQAAREGRFLASARDVLGFGIGSPPVWVHLRLGNASPDPLPRRLTIGQAWLDRIDVHLVHDGTVTARWATGDETRGMPYLDDALGYVFDLPIPTGSSELFIRVSTHDPLVLNIALHSPEAAIALAKKQHYGYGLLYGFLLALVGYNLMLYAGLRQKSQLLYALYLLMFIALNLAYTGRGAVWLWPDAPWFQRYVILILMVMFTHSGLRFAESFLGLAEHAPRLGRAVRIAWWAGPLGILALAALDWHEAAAWFAFVVVTLFVFTMVALGGAMVRQGHRAARYFLVASLSAMVGAGLTDFTVLGILPFNAATFHGLEIGIMLDATLLALALAYFVRVQVSERERAHLLARTDPLTQLFNRRAFLDLAEPLFETARRHNRPLSIIVLDLDHFKALNDRHGHTAGDQALIALGQLLLQTARRGDVVARWGGEEFLVLLPETGLDAAAVLAERLRENVSNLRIVPAPELALSASLGVAECSGCTDLTGLIADADAALYHSKSRGRNCISVANLAGHSA